MKRVLLALLIVLAILLPVQASEWAIGYGSDGWDDAVDVVVDREVVA